MRPCDSQPGCLCSIWIAALMLLTPVLTPPLLPPNCRTDAPVYDYTGETVFYEGTPHRGDLAINVALGTTLVWLPLTFAAISRAAFVKYRFTDRRLQVSTTAPWKGEREGL